jgi:hypothetical protein
VGELDYLVRIVGIEKRDGVGNSAKVIDQDHWQPKAFFDFRCVNVPGRVGELDLPIVYRSGAGYAAAIRSPVDSLLFGPRKQYLDRPFKGYLFLCGKAKGKQHSEPFIAFAHECQISIGAADVAG